ncbi:MAG: hypothetical protein AB7F64_06950 [Gammaproteobacteria bacterium]
MTLITRPLSWFGRKILGPIVDSMLLNNPVGRFLTNYLRRHSGDLLLMNGISSLDYLFIYVSICVFVACPPLVVMDFALTAVILGLRVSVIKEFIDEYLETKIPITDTTPILSTRSDNSYKRALGCLLGVSKPDQVVVNRHLPPDNSSSAFRRAADSITRQYPVMSQLFGPPPKPLCDDPLAEVHKRHRRSPFSASP